MTPTNGDRKMTPKAAPDTDHLEEALATLREELAVARDERDALRDERDQALAKLEYSEQQLAERQAALDAADAQLHEAQEHHGRLAADHANATAIIDHATLIQAGSVGGVVAREGHPTPFLVGSIHPAALMDAQGIEYLPCDGEPYDAKEYRELDAVLRPAHGGCTPNLSGRVVSEPAP